MNDLRPLLQASHSPETRELLRAALDDNPRPGSMQRTALALGVALTTTTGAVAASAASSSLGAGLSTGLSAAKATSAVAGASSPGLTALALKWLIVGVASGGLVAGGAALVQPAPSAQNSRAPSDQAAAGPVSSRVVSESENVQPHELELSRAGAVAEPAERPASGPPPRAGAIEGSASRVAEKQSGGGSLRKPFGKLSREVELIDSARRAVATGDASQALIDLERYERVRETGTLDREARLLRIDALAARGERGSAARLARTYLDQFPDDAHASRLRELVRRSAEYSER